MVRIVCRDFKGALCDSSPTHAMSQASRSEACLHKSEAPPDVEALQKQLSESQKQSERHKSRAMELEDRDAARLLAEQGLRKDVERMAEQLKQREAREAQLAAALKPALMRIAELQQELEQSRVKLAKSEAELADAKKR